jgi:tetratricopeptide (TPR) repeat protein
MKRLRFIVVLSCVCAVSVFAVDDERGDVAMAKRYVAWAETAIAEGRWTEALATLERGMDFVDVSSDMAYLLALARLHERQNAGAVLEAIRYAEATRRWDTYTLAAARFLEAEMLTQLRAFSEALGVLSTLPQSADTICLRLTILERLDERQAFRTMLVKALTDYPRDPRPVHIFLEYAADRLPEANERDIMAIALRRLPFLLEADPELAWLAVPFITDPDENRRILAAYRAINTPAPVSIPVTLGSGLITETQAVDELFSVKPIDKKLLLTVWDMLKSATAQERFKQNITRYSGAISEDIDSDGFVETLVEYRDGVIIAYSYDGNQDGYEELTLTFVAGAPARADFAVPSSSDTLFVYPAPERAVLEWQQYPAILDIRFENTRYVPRLLDFFFTPVHFINLFDGMSHEFLYPERDPLSSSLSKRAMLNSAAFIERPSAEFAGAIERIELENGVPQHASEWLNKQLISETSFSLGRPVSQHVDLDLNGHLETTRRFRQAGSAPVSINLDALEKSVEFIESDWDGDGIFEYAEQHSAGVILRFWDFNHDGIREQVN